MTTSYTRISEQRVAAEDIVDNRIEPTEVIKVLLRAPEAANYLSIAVSTLWMFTKTGRLKSLKLSPRVTCWEKSELDAFIARAY